MNHQVAALCIDWVAKVHLDNWYLFWRRLSTIDDMMLYVPKTDKRIYEEMVAAGQRQVPHALDAERDIVETRALINRFTSIAQMSGRPKSRAITTIYSNLSPIANHFIPGQKRHRVGPSGVFDGRGQRWPTHNFYTPLYSVLPPEQDPDMGD